MFIASAPDHEKTNNFYLVFLISLALLDLSDSSTFANFATDRGLRSITFDTTASLFLCFR
jgi:hypothetical protein